MKLSLSVQPLWLNLTLHLKEKSTSGPKLTFQTYGNWHQIFALASYTLTATPLLLMIYGTQLRITTSCLIMVPNKESSTRFNQPWINNAVKRLSRRKQRCYN